MKPPKETCQLQIPENYRELWEKYILFRKIQHKFSYKAVAFEQIALNGLLELSGGDPALADKIVDQSIAFGYKGLFRLKNNYAKQQAPEGFAGQYFDHEAGR